MIFVEEKYDFPLKIKLFHQNRGKVQSLEFLSSDLVIFPDVSTRSLSFWPYSLKTEKQTKLNWLGSMVIIQAKNSLTMIILMYDLLHTQWGDTKLLTTLRLWYHPLNTSSRYSTPMLAYTLLFVRKLVMLLVLDFLKNFTKFWY